MTTNLTVTTLIDDVLDLAHTAGDMVTAQEASAWKHRLESATRRIQTLLDVAAAARLVLQDPYTVPVEEVRGLTAYETRLLDALQRLDEVSP